MLKKSATANRHRSWEWPSCTALSATWVRRLSHWTGSKATHVDEHSIPSSVPITATTVGWITFTSDCLPTAWPMRASTGQSPLVKRLGRHTGMCGTIGSTALRLTICTPMKWMPWWYSNRQILSKPRSAGRSCVQPKPCTHRRTGRP